MNRVVPGGALVELILPFAPKGRRGRPPFLLETMLRVHFMQQWFTLSDPAMEEALYDMPLLRGFANLSWDTRLPDETTILRFRHLQEKHKLAAVVPHNKPGSRHPEPLVQTPASLPPAGTAIPACSELEGYVPVNGAPARIVVSIVVTGHLATASRLQ
jgi:hypothetical protein